MSKDIKEKSIDSLEVALIIGGSGTGKTTLLEKFRYENPGSLQIISPVNYDEVLDISQIDWESHGGVVIDDLPSFNKTNLSDVVSSLEQDAIKRGKTLLLVIQSMEDLNYLNIQLTTKPMIVEIFGRQSSLSISYNGKKLLTITDLGSAEKAL